MPASTPWVSTPNKTDHLVSGYTSKVIFSYQYPAGYEIANGSDVFDKIINNLGKNYKGNNSLPADYFQGNTDGRSFRITMYFRRDYDGGDLNLTTRVYDLANDTAYEIIQDGGAYTMTSDTGYATVKYESYISFFTDPIGPNLYTQATGAVMFPFKPGYGGVYMIPHNGLDGPLTGGTTVDYRLQILNDGASIYPLSVMIEEIS